MCKRPAPDEASQSKAAKVARLAGDPRSNSGNGGSSARPLKSTYPAQLDVSAHLTAHATQIHSIQRSMRQARSSASTRAWQSLPRSQRRRAASFNLLALPKRLRAKGAAELASSNTLARTRAQTRKRAGKGGKVGGYARTRERVRRQALLERAATPTRAMWLETHLWHAKRFRMSGFEGKLKRFQEGTHGGGTKERWGYSIAEAPNIKGRRAAWRATQEEAAIVDASYTETLRITAAGATEEDRREKLKKMLDQIGCEHGDCTGATACQTTILDYAPGTSQQGARCAAVAPLMLLWIHQSTSSFSASMDIDASSSSSHNGKAPALPSAPATTELLLLIHPAALTSLISTLEVAIATLDSPTAPSLTVRRLASASSVLTTRSEARGRRHSSAVEPGTASTKRTKRGGAKARKQKARRKAQAGEEEEDMDEEERELLREQGFNVFDLYGPHAGRVLGGVLKPVAATSTVKRQAWRSLTRYLKPEQIRPGAALALDVHDPRLSFPPNNTKAEKIDQRAKQQMGSAGTWLCGQGAEGDASGVHKELAQGKLLSEGSRPATFSKGEIDSRRSKSLLPGTRLSPTSSDSIVSVHLIALTSSVSGAASACTVGYRLLLPRTWGSAFWHSLTHTSAHVLSQSSLTHLALELGVPSYPADWIASKAGRTLMRESTKREREEWERRPSAKRVNWTKVGTRWPFGEKGLWKAVASAAEQRLSPSTALVAKRAKEEGQDAVESWLVSSPSAAAAAEHVVNLDIKTQAAALVHVRLTAVRRGAFGAWAEIHLPTSAEAASWRAALLRAWTEEGSESDEGRKEVALLEETIRPPQIRDASLIGAVTNGSYALARGQGEAIASIAWLGWRELELETSKRGKEAKRADGRPPPRLERLVLVRDRKGGAWRAATVKLC